MDGVPSPGCADPVSPPGAAACKALARSPQPASGSANAIIINTPFIQRYSLRRQVAFMRIGGPNGSTGGDTDGVLRRTPAFTRAAAGTRVPYGEPDPRRARPTARPSDWRKFPGVGRPISALQNTNAPSSGPGENIFGISTWLMGIQACATPICCIIARNCCLFSTICCVSGFSFYFLDL